MWAFLLAQMIKDPPVMQETRVPSLGPEVHVCVCVCVCVHVLFPHCLQKMETRKRYSKNATRNTFKVKKMGGGVMGVEDKEKKMVDDAMYESINSLAKIYSNLN